MADISVPVGTVQNRVLFDPNVVYEWLPEDLTGTNTLTVDGHLNWIDFTNYLPGGYSVELSAWIGTIPSSANWSVTVTGSIGFTGELPEAANFQALTMLYASMPPQTAGGFYNGASIISNVLIVQSGAAVRGEGFVLDMTANTLIENSGTIESNGLALIYHDQRFTTPPPSPPGGVPSVSSNLEFGETILVVNAANGMISGGFAGIINDSYSTLRVVNYGALVAQNTDSFWGPPQEGVGFGFDISGAILSLGRLKLTNSGIVDGGIKMGWHTNIITNSGQIIGSVRSEFDTNAQGIVDGNADGDYDDAEDLFFLKMKGTTINNSGAIVGQTIEVEYTDSEGTVHTGYSQIAIATGGARDTVVNHAPSSAGELGWAGIHGSIDLGNGSDRLENYSLIMGDIDMGDAHDTVINGTNGVINGAVTLGQGNDSLTNNGFMDAQYESGPQVSLTIDAGDGNDVFVNNATGQIGAAGVPDPNFALVNPLIFINQVSGSDYFSPGNIVDMGAGNDSVVNEGVIWGAVDLGAGNDTFTGGDRFDLVADAAGRDLYNLGADGDVFYLRGEDFFTDTIHGGDGIDLIFLQDFIYDNSVTSGTTINLNNGTVRTNDVGARIDSVTGFEQVVGTNGDDMFIGSNRAETLVGGFGDDTIIGGGGKDLMIGGDGADVFVFNRASDSRAWSWQRDVIHGLGDDAGDTLHLKFDTNSEIAGTQELTLSMTDIYSTGSAFSGAGSMTHSYLTPDTGPFFEGATRILLQLDINGDGKADFGVEVSFFPLA